MKFTSALKLMLIYVFRINDALHKSCLKIGEITSDEFQSSNRQNPSDDLEQIFFRIGFSQLYN